MDADWAGGRRTDADDGRAAQDRGIAAGQAFCFIRVHPRQSVAEDHAAKASLAAGRRGASPATASAIARMWSGEVPQQPPTRLSSPAWANSRSTAAVSSGVSS